MFRGRLDDQPTRLAQGRAQLPHRPTDSGVDLYLRAQKLRHHLVCSGVSLAGPENTRVGLDQKIAALRVDEKELLLHAERDGELSAIPGGHGPPPARA